MHGDGAIRNHGGSSWRSLLWNGTRNWPYWKIKAASSNCGIGFHDYGCLRSRDGRSQLLFRFLVGEIREPQQQNGRNAEYNANHFGNPPTHRPGQRCCEAAEKPTWPAKPGDPASTRFHDQRAVRIVVHSPPHRIQNPYGHAQGRYHQQHPEW